VPLVSTTIKKSTAARAGVVEHGAPTTADASSGTLGQVLAFVKDAHSHALEQIASLQRDLAESQRATTAQLANVVGAVSGVLSAAGTSGLVKKTTALDAAAAGAPVTVQMMPAGFGSSDAPTMSGTPRNGNASTVAAVAAPSSGFGEAAMTLLVPLMEKVAPVLAYSAAMKMDVPEEVARGVAGFVRSTAQAASLMLKDDDAPASPSLADGEPYAVERRPLAGAELLSHALRIQGALHEDDRAWVSSKLASHPHLLGELKSAVAALTVDEGAASVRTLRGCEALLTAPERQVFDRAFATAGVLPELMRRAVVGRSAGEAVEVLRVCLFRTSPA